MQAGGGEMRQHRFAALVAFAGVGLVLLAGLFLLFAVARPAAAQAPDAATEEEMYRIADKLNCPICQGQRLSECPIQICQEMRQEIVQRLQEGQQEEEIIQAFVDRYGVQVLNQPPIEGFNLLAWVIPFVGLVVVLVIGGWLLRQWSRRRVTVPAVEPAEAGLGELPEEYVRRLEEEVASDQ
ncbi:MAG: cytochrome c-type biogenesis protein CcmH [Chloroflexi bacterium]|nr:MAG: cytochrome c-type biogenesis protein CcmH [Chloroflexota bacterium]